LGITRIISDVHFGDKGSRVRELRALRPLFEGVDQFVLNGDTIDTRPNPAPEQTAALRAETLAFFAQAAPTVFLTGNHDPDISPHHTLDLAEQRVFVTHGDIIFDDLVPWGQDALMLRERIAREVAAIPAHEREELFPRLEAYRRVAASIPQRHQSEKDTLKYYAGLLRDTVWPPKHVFQVLSAWRRAPGLAAALTRRHRPEAAFAVIGHIHHPGVWETPSGVTVINTGSFCPPLGAAVVDLHDDRIALRRVEERGGEFYPGRTVGEFRLPAKKDR
jgi:predicted phosphodiesterase